jgi:hypothetical protein
MCRKAIATFLVILCASWALAQEKGGLVEGTDWAYLASAPAGWVLDRKVLRAQGIEGLFYKDGARYKAAALHLYIQPREKDGGAEGSLAAFMKADQEAYMGAHPGTLIRSLPAYTNAMDYAYPRLEFDDPADHCYQSLAYYEGQRCYFIFVLYCSSPEERSRESDALMELLDSFTYLQKE